MTPPPPAPGSSHALVLSSNSAAGDEPTPPEERAAGLLRPFLDPKEYTAIAVVHGMGARAPKVFDLAKQRHAVGRGVVWVTDPALIKLLAGADAKILKELFSPTEGCLITFFSVKNRRIVSALKWFQATLDEIDKGYLRAGLN